MDQGLQLPHQLIERLHRLTQLLVGLGTGIIGLQGLLQLLETLVERLGQLLGRTLTGELLQIGTHGLDVLEGLVQGRQGGIHLRQRGGHVHVDELVEDEVHLALYLIQPGLHRREHLIACQLDGLIGGGIRIEVEIHHLAAGQQTGRLEAGPQSLLELLAEQGPPLLPLRVGVAMGEALYLDAGQHGDLPALEDLHSLVVDEVGGRDDGADPNAAVLHRRPGVQATHVVLEQEDVVDELIQATGQHARLVLEQGEAVHLLDRLTGCPAWRQPHGDAAVQQALQRVHLHLHPLTAHGDLEARRQPEAGVAAHQDVVGGIDEELVLHLALLGQELGLFYLAYGEALIADGGADPQGTRIAAAEGEPQPLGVHRGERRLVQHGVFTARLALLARGEFDVGPGEQGAKTRHPFPPDPGFDHPELAVLLEHAGGGIGQTGLEHRMAVVIAKLHRLDATHFHLTGADHRLARHYALGGGDRQGETGAL